MEQKRLNVYTDILIDRSSVVSLRLDQSCALFAWNCKRQMNRWTSRAKLVMPVEIIRESNFSSPRQHMKQLEISHAEDFMSTRSDASFPILVTTLR